MANAEVLSIGTELLLGEIQDSNSRYIARRLRDLGIDIYRVTIVGDNEERIAEAVDECLRRSDIVITTGGLGPTIDDPTRRALARALKVDLEYHEDLWQEILERFRGLQFTATENNRRQAYVPRGAHVFHNPVGTAPAFAAEAGARTLISLPGVPQEMEYLFEHEVVPYLSQRYGTTAVIAAKVLHTAGMSESEEDELLGELETMSNPTVGLAAHAGQIDVRITAKGATQGEAQEMIAQIEKVVRERLGEAVFAVDQESLEGVLVRLVAEPGEKTGLLLCGFGGGLVNDFLAAGWEPGLVRTLGATCGLDDLAAEAATWAKEAGLYRVLAASFDDEAGECAALFLDESGQQQLMRRPLGTFGEMREGFARSFALDFLRRSLARQQAAHTEGMAGEG